MFKHSNVFSLSVLIGRGFVLYVHSFSLFLVSLFSFEGAFFIRFLLLFGGVFLLLFLLIYIL